MNRRVAFRFFWGFVICLLAANCPGQSSRPANIVLMYVDNLGYGDLGCYGNIGIQTPHIDQLATRGVLCTDFYVTSPTCTVSRGALLTGRHDLRNGLVKQLGPEENWYGVGLPHRERIIPQYLQEVGYTTACFGKWNIGFAPGSRPTERGFDEFLGCRSGNIHYFHHTYHGEYDIFKGVERYPVNGYSTDVFADAACRFIRNQDPAGKPFFLYLPFNAPHYVSKVNTAEGEKPQWQVPEEYLKRYGWPDEESNEKRRYFAVLTALDDAVGRVVGALADRGFSDNTLLMFISDMGAILRPTHGFDAASNAPFRGDAPQVYEGGIRVPAIFSWPGILPTGSVNRELLSHLDVLPLCLRAANRDLPADRRLDGRDPLPALTGQAGTPHEYVVAHLTGAVALRKGRWKIVRPSSKMGWELYDLETNPTESIDVASKNPEELDRLVRLFHVWQQDVSIDASQPVPYVPVGKR